MIAFFYLIWYCIGFWHFFTFDISYNDNIFIKFWDMEFLSDKHFYNQNFSLSYGEKVFLYGDYDSEEKIVNIIFNLKRKFYHFIMNEWINGYVFEFPENITHNGWYRIVWEKIKGRLRYTFLENMGKIDGESIKRFCLEYGEMDDRLLAEGVVTTKNEIFFYQWIYHSIRDVAIEDKPEDYNDEFLPILCWINPKIRNWMLYLWRFENLDSKWINQLRDSLMIY